MRRREFLCVGGRVLLGASTLGPGLEFRWKARPDPGFAALEGEIRREMVAAGLPGFSMAVITAAKLAWRKGFGTADADSKRAVDLDTIFPAESMSKPVFAYAVLKLCETGVLDLDTPLVKYTPYRPLDDPRLDLITARHVLSHTAGFQNWRSEREPLSIHFTPGSQWMYSGEGYSFLQAVVTRLAGRVNTSDCRTYEPGLEVCATDIEDYMKANVLLPFGMKSSGYTATDLFERRGARRHDRAGAPLPKRHPTAIDAARYAAAGDLYTTPSDYARFLIEVMDPKPADRFRLKSATLAEMLRPAVKLPPAPPPAPQSSWALGWRIFHLPEGDLVSHGGDGAGAHCWAGACRARKSGFVMMTNGDGGVQVMEKLAAGDTLRRIIFG